MALAPSPIPTTAAEDARPGLSYRDAGILEWAVAGASLREVEAALVSIAEEAGPAGLREMLGAAVPAGQEDIAAAYVGRRLATVKGLLTVRASFAAAPAE